MKYTHAFAHAKVETWILYLKIPRNGTNLDIILNDFESSTRWAIQNEDRFTGLENPEIPGIQPTHLIQKSKLYVPDCLVKNCTFSPMNFF